jgi:prolyl 4-hydroxylase
MPHKVQTKPQAKTQSKPQTITPELRQWIVDQAQSGCSAESVLKAMTDAGWQEDVAIEAMEGTLREHLNQTATSSAQASQLPPLMQVPEPALANSPLCIDAGDRQVEIISAISQPRVVVFGNLLSSEECDALIEAAKPRMARSLTVSVKDGGEELNADRTSNGMFFARGESELITRIEARIAKLVNWPVQNGEGLQVLHYRPGAEYKPHYDYFDPSEPGTPTILKRGGQRVATLIMYLAAPSQGGGTVFPDLHLEVAPKRGNGVFFSYDRAHPSSKSLHGGAPVVAGEKWIATKWLREGEFV